MADYWKSQPRKFCDFCKCWIADNKPSRDFHERGKRHQQAVKDKLTELKKKGVRDAKKERENNVYLQEMEKEAMKKFKQDLADNPELAKQYAGNREVLTAQQRDKIELEKQLKGIVKQKMEEQDPGDWQEAYTEEGYVYYWNDKSAESSWYAPGCGKDGGSGGKDGGFGGKDGEKNSSGDGKKKAKIDAKNIQLQTPMTEMQKKKENDVISGKNKKVNRDKISESKDGGVVKAGCSKDTIPSGGIKTIRNHTGFGAWTTVEGPAKTSSFIDIQLPKVKEKAWPVLPPEDAFEPFEITERTISSASTGIRKPIIKLDLTKGKKEGGVNEEVKEEVREVKVAKKRKMNLRPKDEDD